MPVLDKRLRSFGINKQNSEVDNRKVVSNWQIHLGILL